MKFWRNKPTGDELMRALSVPVPSSIRLLSEFIETGDTNHRTLLVTSPTNGPWAALAAGDFAAAAMDMGWKNLRLVDLRKTPTKEEENSFWKDMARPVEIFRPTSSLVGEAGKLHKWVNGMTASSTLAIVLCGGILDPLHWSEDPAAWVALNAKVIVAAGEGIHTENQVSEAAFRLRRTGLLLTGGILVGGRKSGKTNRGTQDKEMKQSSNSELLAGEAKA